MAGITRHGRSTPTTTMYPVDLIRSELTSFREIPGGPVRACFLLSRCQSLARARVARLPGLGLYCRLHPIPQTDVGCSRTPSADNAALTEGEKNLPRCICRHAFSLLPFFLSSSPPPHLLCFFDKVARNKEGKKERRKKNPQKPHTQPC